MVYADSEFVSSVDVNECELNSELCTGGTCVNTDGSYTCSCPHGYTVYNDNCIGQLVGTLDAY